MNTGRKLLAVAVSYFPLDQLALTLVVILGPVAPRLSFCLTKPCLLEEALCNSQAAQKVL